MMRRNIFLILFSTVVISSIYAGKKPNLVTEGEFEGKVLKSEKFVVVTFFGSWCPNKDVSIEDMNFGEQDQAKIEFYCVDINQEQGLVTRYTIKGSPTIVYFKKGMEMGRNEGYMDKKEVIVEVKKMFEKCKNL